MHTDPKTKEQFVDRILSYDFDGDFTSLGVYRAQLVRLSPNKFALTFPATGQLYELTVKKPRGPRTRPVAKTRRRPTGRTAAPEAPEPITVARRSARPARPLRRA